MLRDGEGAYAAGIVSFREVGVTILSIDGLVEAGGRGGGLLGKMKVDSDTLFSIVVVSAD